MSLAHDLVSFAATALLDEDGRPVAEVASPLYPATPTELVACPYADRRAGQPMNRTALRQMTAVWPALLASYAAMGRPQPTAYDAWRAAITGVAIPLVTPRPVPRLASGIFKASLGLSQVFSALLLSADGVADTPLSALGDGEAFFAELDRGGWLLGADQVCAGTAPMIGQVFEALTGALPVGPCPPEVQGWRDQVAAVAPVAVGLHTAHLLLRQAAARRGEGDPVIEEVPPWMRAVFALPGRPAEHVRRLFPRGGVPAAVEGLLAGGSFAAALDTLATN